MTNVKLARLKRISPYVFPGLPVDKKQISHVPLKYTNGHPKITIKVKTGIVYLNAYTLALTNLTPGNRIDFLIIGESLLFYNCEIGGYKLYNVSAKSDALVCSPRTLVKELNSMFYLKNRSGFSVTETAKEYRQSALYQIRIPIKYKRRK